MEHASPVVRAAMVLASMVVCAGANSLDFRTVRAPGAVLFDAPSQGARKVFILGAGYPVEVVVSIDGWRKIRDASGALAWIAVDGLSDEKRVMVTANRAPVKQSADDEAPTLFEVQQGVLLEVLETSPGWLKVRHRDGSSGYLRSAQAWGG